MPDWANNLIFIQQAHPCSSDLNTGMFRLTAAFMDKPVLQWENGLETHPEAIWRTICIQTALKLHPAVIWQYVTT